MTAGPAHWWQALRGWLGGRAADPAASVRAPRIKRGWRYTELQFTGGVSQSRMRTFRPSHLLIDYTRTMMASLLFRPQPARIGMIGLGGGSQAKFCYRHLPATRLEVAENNPQVLALRRRFHVPPDDDRLQVSLADGAQFARERRGCFDILLVDGYDETGIPPALSSQAFYDDCRDALVEGGVLAGNLYATDFRDHVEKLERSFGRGRVWVLEEARQSNRVVFAWTGDPFPGGSIDLAAVAARMPAGARRELEDVLLRVAQAWRRR